MKREDTGEQASDEMRERLAGTERRRHPEGPGRLQSNAERRQGQEQTEREELPRGGEPAWRKGKPPEGPREGRY